MGYWIGKLGKEIQTSLFSFLFAGFRAFQAANLRLSATLRSTASSEGGDKPPPYEEDLPPTYNEALKMSGGDTIAAVSAVMTSCRSSSSSLSTAAAGPSSSQAVAGSTAEHSAPSQPGILTVLG